jgi:hypothetical protein
MLLTDRDRVKKVQTMELQCDRASRLMQMQTVRYDFVESTATTFYLYT